MLDRFGVRNNFELKLISEIRTLSIFMCKLVEIVNKFTVQARQTLKYFEERLLDFFRLYTS